MPAKKRPSVKKFESDVPRKSGRTYLLLILVIAMALSAAYLLIKGVQVTEELGDEEQAIPQQTDQQEPQISEESLIERVKRHIIVNENEAPYVRTIGNIELLQARNPIFYKDAEQGDKVLIWSDKAVIYSETKDLLVAATMAFPPSYTGATSTAELLKEEEEEPVAEQEIENPTVEIRNGSRIPGEAGRLRTKLTDQDVNVQRIGDAGNIYEGSLIIDLTGGRASTTIQIIEDAIEGSVTAEMPAGEPESNANILIIIGR